MNQPYARVNQPNATLTLASALREMFGVQLYNNNARALLSRISSILNLDWLQHARSVRGVYECLLSHQESSANVSAKVSANGRGGCSGALRWMTCRYKMTLKIQIFKFCILPSHFENTEYLIKLVKNSLRGHYSHFHMD